MDLNIYVYGLLAGLFTWGMTALGASLVIFFKNIKQIYLDIMLGIAAGVMIAASFTSLIIPAFEYADNIDYPINSDIFVLSGILVGGCFILFLDKIIPHIHAMTNRREGPKSKLRRSTLLVSAITLHNIPEGLAVGVAFGAYNATGETELLVAAITLAIGIAIQNFPEGAAVSFPLMREGFSRKKSFFIGQASALVEPVGIFVGIALVSYIVVILPFALSFAAGAMLYVVIEELIPESQANNHTDIVTISTIIGLIIMVGLDVMLG